MQTIDITDWQTRRLTVLELGRVAGVSQRTVWRLVAAGRLPKPHKIGGNCTRWDGAEVAQALAAQESLPPKPNPNPLVAQEVA